MALIEQAVRAYDLRPSTYVADAYAELGMIEHALRWDSPSDYVAAAADEMALIEQAVRAYDLRPSTYVPDANLEMALIEQAVLAAS
jgi:coenzyme F420-reducing hydrogenase alpha subunit